MKTNAAVNDKRLQNHDETNAAVNDERLQYHDETNAAVNDERLAAVPRHCDERVENEVECTQKW
jgi:hypothetical protein